MKRESHGNAWHPCQYVDCKLEHDGSWVDGKWYEWEDVRGNREVARMKLDAIDHFYPHAKIIKGECLWVEWKVNLYTVKSCPYISTQSFAQNWELPRYNSK